MSHLPTIYRNTRLFFAYSGRWLGISPNSQVMSHLKAIFEPFRANIVCFSQYYEVSAGFYANLAKGLISLNSCLILFFPFLFLFVCFSPLLLVKGDAEKGEGEDKGEIRGLPPPRAQAHSPDLLVVWGRARATAHYQQKLHSLYPSCSALYNGISSVYKS